MIQWLRMASLALLPVGAMAQFAPPAGQAGTTAMHKDSSAFVGWAASCVVVRGHQNIADPNLGPASAGDAAMALGRPQQNGTVSLGDGGTATLTFSYPIKNGPGPDFAVFENAFLETFLELAFVEVSSDGQRFVRFPAISLTQDSLQIDAFGAGDATKIHNLAGKYITGFGTPFDLEDLIDSLGLDIQRITHIRLVDVVGAIQEQYASLDHLGNRINDPWPTPFASSGFDLDAVGVIHQADISSADHQILPGLQLYPNPATEATALVWHAHQTETIEYEVFSAAGALLASGQWTPAVSGDKLDLGTFLIAVPGLKIVRIQTAQGQKFFKVF